MAISQKLKKAVRGETPEPQLREVIAHFVQLNGGARAVAKLLHDEWHAAPPGGMTRQRILDSLLRGMWRVNEKAGNSLDDLGQLSEEDLDRELTLRVAKFDGKEESATDGGKAAG